MPQLLQQRFNISCHWTFHNQPANQTNNQTTKQTNNQTTKQPNTKPPNPKPPNNLTTKQPNNQTTRKETSKCKWQKGMLVVCLWVHLPLIHCKCRAHQEDIYRACNGTCILNMQKTCVLVLVWISGALADEMQFIHFLWLNHHWLVFQPLSKIWKSVGMMKFPIYGKRRNVPNHQPNQFFGGKSQFFRPRPPQPALISSTPPVPRVAAAAHAQPRRKRRSDPRGREPGIRPRFPSFRRNHLSKMEGRDVVSNHP